jgi:cytochrome c
MKGRQRRLTPSSVQEKARMVMCVFGRMAGVIVLGFGLVIGGNAMAGDAVKGQKLFKRCKACHYVDKEKHKTGPHLVAVIGRAAGSLDDYKYSKAMKASGLVWDEETLAAYLKAPKKFVKGTKMAFAGLKKDRDVADIIAYLKAAN